MCNMRYKTHRLRNGGAGRPGADKGPGAIAGISDLGLSFNDDGSRQDTDLPVRDISRIAPSGLIRCLGTQL